jgi:hypothetical protein
MTCTLSRFMRSLPYTTFLSFPNTPNSKSHPHSNLRVYSASLDKVMVATGSSLLEVNELSMYDSLQSSSFETLFFHPAACTKYPDLRRFMSWFTNSPQDRAGRGKIPMSCLLCCWIGSGWNVIVLATVTSLQVGIYRARHKFATFATNQPIPAF